MIERRTMIEDKPITDQELDEATVLSVMLTTYDNPYNPHTDYDKWQAYDLGQGYNTAQLLARIEGDPSLMLDGVEQAQTQAMAMNYLIDEGPIDDLWITIRKEDKTPIRNPT